MNIMLVVANQIKVKVVFYFNFCISHLVMVNFCVSPLIINNNTDL